MKKWIIAGVVTAAAVVLFWGLTGSGEGDKAEKDMPIADAQQGDLVIDVLEGGNIQALNFLEFRNEVKSPNGVKILELIDEGYYVTAEDVKNEKVLVRLDQSELEEAIVDHDVARREALAALKEIRG